MGKKVIIAFLGNVKYDARCINISNTLFNYGYKVIIVDELDGENNILEHDRFKIIHIDTKTKTGITRYWKYHFNVQKIARYEKPDIFISADLFSLAVCSYQNKHCIKIFDSREIYSKLASLVGKPIKQFFWFLYEKKYYKKMDKVLVTAEKDKDFLISQYGYKDIEIIFNFPAIQTNKCKINLRDKFKITENNKIFIYQGVVQEGRGIEEMINLLTYFKDCVACIVGDGEYKSEIINLVQKLKITNRVFFTGKIPYTELLSLTKQADIGFSLIQPLSESYKQALPNKLFEYGLAGIPTIGSDFIEMKIYIKKFKLGIAVPSSSVREHINAVQKLLMWDDSNRLINTVKDNLTWESQESKFIKIFDKNYAIKYN